MVYYTIKVVKLLKKNKNKKYDYIINLNITSPLRKISDKEIILK